MGYYKKSVLNFHKTLLLLPVEYYYHTLCFRQIYGGIAEKKPFEHSICAENGIHKYMCTLSTHFKEITFHTLLKYFDCNYLHRCFFPCTVILFSFHCTFCQYAAFINRLGKQVYTWSFLSPKRSLERWCMPQNWCFDTSDILLQNLIVYKRQV